MMMKELALLDGLDEYNERDNPDNVNTSFCIKNTFP